MCLAGPDGALWVQGGEQPLPVPAGNWELYSYREYLSPTPWYESAGLHISQQFDKPVPNVGVSLKAGAETPLPIGTPLHGRLVVTRNKGALRFELSFTENLPPLEERGMIYLDLVDAGRRPVDVERFQEDTPSTSVPVRVTLTPRGGGNPTTFEGTYYEAASRGWKIPAGFKGTYTATMEFLDTFAVEVEPATVKIP
jgi:hypothetical protein